MERPIAYGDQVLGLRNYIETGIDEKKRTAKTDLPFSIQSVFVDSTGPRERCRNLESLYFGLQELYEVLVPLQ